MQTEYAVVGTSVPRTGLADKIRGMADYTADLKRPGMLYARCCAARMRSSCGAD